MTFRQWSTANGLNDLPDVVYRYADAGWQAAQVEERKRSMELIGVLQDALRYVPTGYENPRAIHARAKAAIAKYEG